MSQYDSLFEENLYQQRRDTLQKIADLVRASNPSLSDIEAKYPNTFAFTHTLPELRALGDPLSTEALEARHIEAAIAGRIMAIRVQGKAGFATLQQNGQRLQIYVRKDDVGDDLFALYKLLDLGDHIGVRGFLMRTRTGELTLHATGLTFLAKAMLALPDKFHGLEDIELRYRRRYLDLFTDTGETTAPATDPGAPRLASETWVEPPQPPTSDPTDQAALKRAGFSPSIPPTEQPGASAPEAPPTPTRLPAREVFVKRAAILRSIRKFFDDRHYLEVETPMLHTISGGAAARPFETHHNALDIPLKLRIAPELYLKRLVVGGLDRVYEINRNFRNEGVSTQHNPEFTMLEFYQAYANYKDLMTLTKELIAYVAKEVNNTTKTNFNGVPIDLAPENWRELSMRTAINEFMHPEASIEPFTDEEFSNRDLLAAKLLVGRNNLRKHLDRQPTNAEWTPEATPLSREWIEREILENSVFFFDLLAKNLIAGQSLGKKIADLFEYLAEPHLIQPTIIYDFPLAVSPLSKVKPNEPDWVERFEFYIGGFEVGNAFSELNDPDDQRARFEAQLEDRKRGDDEAMAEVDEDYVRALGYGLPPTAGEGIGIDRLTMILTGSRSIRDVILFPLMRPQKPTPTDDATPAE